MTLRSAPVLLVLGALLAAADATKLQAQHSAVTRIRAIKTDYHWAISNYTLYRHKQGDFFESPVITTHDEDLKLNWSVVVYPRGSSENQSDDSFGVYLMYVDGDLEDVRVRYTIHLLDEDEEDFATVDYEEVVERGEGVGLPRLAGAGEIVDPANRVLDDDELRIYVEFVAFIGDSSFSNDCRRGGRREQPYVDHLEPYLGNFEYSDLTISAENAEIRAHRVLLASRSRVFDEIFKNYGTGHAVLRFTIEDFGAETVALALRYMYTGMIGKMNEERAAELLAMTYKYDIEGLKELVLEELCLALDMDPEERTKVLEEIEHDATEVARRLPADAQKACSVVPIDLSKVYEIE